MLLLSGASGFVGRAIIQSLHFDIPIKALVRDKDVMLPKNVIPVVCDLASNKYFSPTAMDGVDVLIHSAARTNVMIDEVADPLMEYRRVNVDGTLNLARQASLAGVKRFILLSSIKVNGEGTILGRPFLPEDSPAPEDSYGISKLEAEAGLLKLAAETGMEVVIIRPPLVYGPGVKANFGTMVNWVTKDIPLPFGNINNKRSLIAIDNLVSFILLCSDRAKSPKAANQVFLVSDGEDVSTTTLFRKVARAYCARSRLLPVPVSFMRLVAKLLGKSYVADRLFGNLQVDSSKSRDLLGWKPVVTMDEQLKKMADFDKNSG